jgi:hypothetical protein
MDELVKSFRLGVVQIFGIMVPGLVLLASLAYALLGGNHLDWGIDWKSYRIEVAAGVMILSYLLGFIVRLIPMDSLDFFASLWLKLRLFVRRKWNRRPQGFYPYRNLKDLLRADGLKGLESYVLWGPDKEQEARSPVNALKLLVANESQVLASALASSEANIRMMFGFFVAGTVALVVLIWTKPTSFLPLAVVISLSLFWILHTFTQTRYNELVKLLTALKVCSKGKDSVVDQVMLALRCPEQHPPEKQKASGEPSVVPTAKSPATVRASDSHTIAEERSRDGGSDVLA